MGTFHSRTRTPAVRSLMITLEVLQLLPPLRPDAIVTGDPRNIKPSIEQLKALRPRFVLVILPAGKIPLYRELFGAPLLLRQADVFMKTADVFMKTADGSLKTAVLLNELSLKGELIWVLANTTSFWEVTSFKRTALERFHALFPSLDHGRSVGSLVCLSLRGPETPSPGLKSVHKGHSSMLQVVTK